jgi:hypothetical protein
LPAIAIEDSVIPLWPDQQIIRRPGDLLHPERESQEALDRIKAEIGSMMFSAQYQQQPVPLKGNYILREWFQFVEQPPALGPGDRVVKSWDIASATGEVSDYPVCTTWHMKGRDYYLIDVFRGRLEYPALRRARDIAISSDAVVRTPFTPTTAAWAEITAVLSYLRNSAYPFERVGKDKWKWGGGHLAAAWRWTP